MTTKTTTTDQVGDLLRAPYSRILIPEDEGGFSAEILEFPGCFAQGETAEETYSNLEESARSWLLACVETGRPVPEPIQNHEASGRFALRMPRSLYLRASKAAARDRISLNQYIVTAVAEHIAVSSAMYNVQTAIRREVQQLARHVALALDAVAATGVGRFSGTLDLTRSSMLVADTVVN